MGCGCGGIGGGLGCCRQRPCRQSDATARTPRWPPGESRGCRCCRCCWDGCCRARGHPRGAARVPNFERAAPLVRLLPGLLPPLPPLLLLPPPALGRASDARARDVTRVTFSRARAAAPAVAHAMRPPLPRKPAASDPLPAARRAPRSAHAGIRWLWRAQPSAPQPADTETSSGQVARVG